MTSTLLQRMKMGSASLHSSEGACLQKLRSKHQQWRKYLHRGHRKCLPFRTFAQQIPHDGHSQHMVWKFQKPLSTQKALTVTSTWNEQKPSLSRVPPSFFNTWLMVTVNMMAHAAGQTVFVWRTRHIVKSRVQVLKIAKDNFHLVTVMGSGVGLYVIVEFPTVNVTHYSVSATKTAAISTNLRSTRIWRFDPSKFRVLEKVFSLLRTSGMRAI